MRWILGSNVMMAMQFQAMVVHPPVSKKQGSVVTTNTLMFPILILTVSILQVFLSTSCGSVSMKGTTRLNLCFS
jgi:hypothetical protein